MIKETQSALDLPLDFLVLVNRHRRFLLRATCLGLLLGILLAFLLPVRYTAIARILPPQNQVSAASLLAGQLGGGSIGALASAGGGGALGSLLGTKNPADLYIGILKTNTVADSLISHFNLANVYRTKRASDTRKRLASRSLFQSEKEGLISITVEDRDAQRAADLANAYVDALHKLNAQLTVSDAAQRRAFFEQQLVNEKDALADAEVELRKTQESTGLIEPRGQSQLILYRIEEVRAQVAAGQVALDALRLSQTPSNPQYQRAAAQVEGLRAELQRLENSRTSGAEGGQVSSGNLPKAGLEYLRKYRDVRYHETLFELLARQFEVAKLDEARSVPLIQVVDSAEKPDRRSFPPRLLLIAGLTVIAALCAISYLVLRDMFGAAWSDAMIRSRSQPSSKSRA